MATEALFNTHLNYPFFLKAGSNLYMRGFELFLVKEKIFPVFMSCVS